MEKPTVENGGFTRWNTKIAQAEDRIHRIGQDKDVVMIDILSNAKIDSRIIDCLDRKESLSESFKRELKTGKGKEFLT